MKKILTILALVLMAIGYTSLSAKAQNSADMTAAEELTADTFEMSSEAEADFKEAVDCMDQAMEEGETESTDCVSKAEDYDHDIEEEHGHDGDHGYAEDETENME